jgi:hypothetical protein
MTCVGAVAYFIKATLRDTPGAKRAAKALGLPECVQRFALVDAYVVDNVQVAAQKLSLQDKAVEAVAGALVDAKIIKSKGGFLDLLRWARDAAPVLALRDGALVHLRGSGDTPGTLKRLAIPLSSNWPSLYHDTDNWTVAPVCRIDPRKVQVQMPTDCPAEMQSAINSIRKTRAYFVHTYSMSNSTVRAYKHDTQAH